MGHIVVPAANGAAALQAADRKLDFALIDIGLPDMDGYEVARRLREKSSDQLRLVALTGYANQEYRERASAAGFDNYLTKPVALAELTRVLCA